MHKSMACESLGGEVIFLSEKLFQPSKQHRVLKTIELMILHYSVLVETYSFQNYCLTWCMAFTINAKQYCWEQSKKAE